MFGHSETGHICDEVDDVFQVAERAAASLVQGIQEYSADGVRERFENQVIIVHETTICDHMVTCRMSVIY